MGNQPSSPPSPSPKSTGPTASSATLLASDPIPLPANLPLPQTSEEYAKALKEAYRQGRAAGLHAATGRFLPECKNPDIVYEWKGRTKNLSRTSGKRASLKQVLLCGDLAPVVALLLPGLQEELKQNQTLTLCAWPATAITITD